MPERDVTRAIHRLVEDTVPQSPWLEHRVMAAVREDAAGNRRRQSRFTLPSMALATVAAVLIGLLAVGVLYESRLVQSSRPAPASSPSTDPAIVGYRHKVEAYMSAIDGAYVATICNVRQLCRDNVIKMREKTQALVDDLTAARAPSRIEPQASNLLLASQRLLSQLDHAIAAMNDPASDFTAIYYALNTDSLDLAFAVVDCWPMTPYVRPDLLDGYGCEAVPTADLHGSS